MLSKASGSTPKQSVLQPVQLAAEASGASRFAAPARPQALPKRSTNTKYPFRLPDAQLEKLRDASVELRRSMNSIVIDALEAELERIEAALGGEIPPRLEADPRVGRPVSPRS